MKALYIHIPFCRKICSYCDFCKVIKMNRWVKPYYEALKNEILDRYQGEEISSVYFGGGTPSSLDENQLKWYLELVKLFNLKKGFEFTFECNIEDINEDMLYILKEYGVNRLSIGIQTFNPLLLELLNREALYEDAKGKINLARSFGFNNINIDLIYAISFQDEKMLKEDLEKFVSLKPNHISTYSLMILEHTMLYNEHVKPISEDIDYKMYQMIIKYLKKHKYKHYEVSNFALPGYESRHNKTYWKNLEYYGFGVSASGYIDGIRYTNTKNLSRYLKGDYHGEEEILTNKDIMDNEVMLGLRLMDGINMDEFEKKYNKKIEDVYPIKPLVKNKELEIKKGYLFIPEDKIYVMNEILCKLI